MRRIINNTTAIAACLSLMAPHLAAAQTTAAPEAGAEQQPAGDGVTCADGTAAPCETSAPVAAPAEETPAEEAPAEEAAPEEAPAADAPAAETPAEAAPAEPAPEAEAAPAQPEPEPEAAPEAEAEATPEAPDEEAAASTEAEPEPAADAPVGASDADADASGSEVMEAMTPADESTDAAELEKALEAEADKTDAPEANSEAQAAPAADANADANATATEPEPKAEATDAEALKKAMEAKSTETQAEVEPATPAAGNSEASNETATAAPEEGAKETEAAKEAAEVTAAPVAAALNASDADAEVTEETITEDNTRSSAEDFATNLRDAMAGNGDGQPAEQQASNDDDDDNNDLVKALLIGGAGVAVGAMLANNRQVALSSPDRVVVTRADGSQQVIKDEVALLRQPGSTVKTENFSDGSSRTIVTRADGSQVVTIRDADLRVLQRTLVSADGTTRQLIDDTAAEPVDIANLPAPAPTSRVTASQMDEAELRAALMAQSAADRRFTLAQVRDIAQVRSLVAPVNIDSITFDTGSAAIKPDQAEQLAALGDVIRGSIAENPNEMFMIEGYTDTVGSDAANLALSDRRAESVALALTEYFDVPPENMVVQGYGEQFLMVNREGDLRENRRASVRRITDLLQTASN
ncbi:OmpA family protein [Paracoccus aurantiacus]|uniref:OmpA family protein n=1 Tax=Paracoccus aurantiacus TaxID=2599412 RepID=A0A5C6S8W5_9RHOB|nr:OmpA family protein [Paracoccus aurantiacus]TXB70552.1 OmpA family protein [Paracoccus aurantiacus]